MKRVVAIALLISLVHAPAAFAGETLLQAAAKAVDQVVAAEMQAQPARADRVRPSTGKRTSAPTAANYQQPVPGLQEAGIGRRTKVLLGLGVAAALAGIMLSIDGGVEDSTPSTRGERTNKPY